MTTGLDLKLRRVALDVKGKDVAAAMGVAASYVSRLENQRSVTDEQAERYVGALDMCATKSTRENSASAA